MRISDKHLATSGPDTCLAISFISGLGLSFFIFLCCIVGSGIFESGDSSSQADKKINSSGCAPKTRIAASGKNDDLLHGILPTNSSSNLCAKIPKKEMLLIHEEPFSTCASSVKKQSRRRLFDAMQENNDEL